MLNLRKKNAISEGNFRISVFILSPLNDRFSVKHNCKASQQKICWDAEVRAMN
jgi:hypothetical protein